MPRRPAPPDRPASKGSLARKTFWQSMSAEQRADFVARRAEKVREAYAKLKGQRS